MCLYSSSVTRVFTYTAIQRGACQRLVGGSTYPLDSEASVTVPDRDPVADRLLRYQDLSTVDRWANKSRANP